MVAAEGEGLRDADGAHAQAAQEAAFGGADEQHALFMGQALEHLEHLALGRLVKIDQQVAAEHEIEGRFTGQQARIQDIAHLQPHLLTNPLAQAITLAFFRVEMPLAKLDGLATKGILAVQRSLGPLHRQRADVQAVDLELMRRQAAIEQGHGDGIGLLAGGARQAQQAQGPHALDLRQPPPWPA